MSAKNEDVTLRRYRLESNDESGWAIIVLGSDGYFSAVSDHGNYAYIWSAPGMEFRRFLIRIRADYFHSKITHMRESDVWDAEEVEKNIRKRLDELVAAGKVSQRQADSDFEEAEGNLDSLDAVFLWLSECNLPDFDIHEGISATKKELWSWAFATRVLPRLQALLCAEIEAEEAIAAQAGAS